MDQTRSDWGREGVWVGLQTTPGWDDVCADYPNSVSDEEGASRKELTSLKSELLKPAEQTTRTHFRPLLCR